MPKTIHTVVLADGTEVTRETASRKYTHVIIRTVTQAEALRSLETRGLVEKRVDKMNAWGGTSFKLAAKVEA